MITSQVFFTTFVTTLVLSTTSKNHNLLCQSMVPETKSNTEPQATTVPFQVILDKETVHPGDIVTLVLLPIGAEKFMVYT